MLLDHLNMDYPFNLKGILYFPRINTEYDAVEGTIKLYNNQVFIADNVKEVIPEYLKIMKGVIDCPDLPLNVSRSALQNDGFVQKISDYISKKVADKLVGMFKTDREEYEKNWDNISPFLKYGCLKEEKFGDKMKDAMLFKNLDHKYLTLAEYMEENTEKPDETEEIKDTEVVEGEVVETETAEDETAAEESVEAETVDTGDEPEVVEAEVVDGETEDEDTDADTAEADEEPETEEEKPFIVYYVTDEQQQSQYIHTFRSLGQDAVILSHNIDSAYISYLEQKNENVKFMRIDADVQEALKDEVSEDEKESFEKLSETIVKVFKKELDNDQLEVKVEKLKDDSVASMAVLSEESRRMEEMMRMYGMDTGAYSTKATLILNANHPLVKFVAEHKRSKNVSIICKQLYDQAMLTHKPLDPDEMTAYVQRSNEIMMLLTK